MCEACLVFIDKCPVCRATFEEYVTIKPASSDADASTAAAAAAGTSSGTPKPSSISVGGADITPSTSSVSEIYI